MDMIIKYAQCNRSRSDYCRYEDGEAMARELGASGYRECSMLSQEALEEIFEAGCECVAEMKQGNCFQRNMTKNLKTNSNVLFCEICRICSIFI